VSNGVVPRVLGLSNFFLKVLINILNFLGWSECCCVLQDIVSGSYGFMSDVFLVTTRFSLELFYLFIMCVNMRLCMINCLCVYLQLGLVDF